MDVYINWLCNTPSKELKKKEKKEHDSISIIVFHDYEPIPRATTNTSLLECF